MRCLAGLLELVGSGLGSLLAGFILGADNVRSSCSLDCFSLVQVVGTPVGQEDTETLEKFVFNGFLR